MSLNNDWDVDKYKVEHECEEHWLLRRRFMERWRNEYPEERLVCLAQVFANIEFMGCRYPTQVMLEVARLSQDIAQQYRKSKKTKLQRTVVSASDAAVDRARCIKREGRIIKEVPEKKTRIDFVPQGSVLNTNSQPETVEQTNVCKKEEKLTSEVESLGDYLNEMSNMKCLETKCFSDKMFNTEYGQFVLLIRSWCTKLTNIQASCQACRIHSVFMYRDNTFFIYIEDILLAKAENIIKVAAKRAAADMAWDILCKNAVCVYIKEAWVSQGDRVSLSDVAKKDEFGVPVENNIALKMMKLMGWKGGGLGADAQGIEEPIKPHLQIVKRAGLGINKNIHKLRKAGHDLMKRFKDSETFDVDLVFSGEFSKDERAVLHQCAQKAGLASKSYGDVDRFLVVTKKLDPFSLARAVIKKGGDTPKYQVFLPEALKCR